MFDNIIHELIIIGHVIFASLLAGLIGLEREFSGKPAGLRTNMIVGGAAALIISIGKVLIEDYSSDLQIAESLRTDPLRVIEAVVVGVSFIGAGTILKVEDKSKVQYLTTAAVILFSAGIGMSVALQQYILAVGVTVFILLINVGANYIDRWISRKQNKKGGS
ncbi:MAG TPA: MgtC/SapB family protein [Bacteroidales bacterium]|nr:MgtC/SapB family protein [Bacteroidales bacterium]